MNINNAIKSAMENYQAGNLQQAETIYKKILRIKPNHFNALHMLGVICLQSKNYDAAIPYIKRAIQFHPDSANLYSNLGVALQEKGQLDEAITYYQKALELNTNQADVYNNMGAALQEKGQLDEAITCYQKAITLNPDHIQAYHALAAALVCKWQLNEAINVNNKILQVNASDVNAYYRLGNILMTQGKLSEAEKCFKHAIQLKPDELKPYRFLLMLMSYYPKYSGQNIYYEHLQFAKQFEEPLHSKIFSHTNERIINRRLKIGYVSPDFLSHPVAYFIEPVLISHNRDLFELFCYSDVSSPDEVTNRIKKYSDQWRNIVGTSDEKVAELIRKDKIDILVDLAGHTGIVNRILLFAHKPAPVQVSWIGYPTTTGLSTIDYKIVDSYTDPLGMTEQFYTEKLLRLPEIFLCYLPDKDSPDVDTLPGLTSGYITFGSLNNFVKVTPDVIALWSTILKAVPNSRLIMKSYSFFDITTRSYAKNLFINEGIEAERIELLQPVPSIKDHLSLYNKIDIALDTFPYNGTTTTCDALWMGVPVITLAGNTHASRVGISLLSNVGLPDLIANTSDEYALMAVNLTKDLRRLQSLRERLRGMMKDSSLCDAKRFTGNLEWRYRQMWETWCTSL